MSAHITNLRQQLETAVAANDSAEFGRIYTSFLSQYDTFNAAYAGDTISSETQFDFRDAIFGETHFALNHTTNEEATIILANAKAASEVFGSLPVDDRLDFLNILKQKIDAHADEITLTITADMGKPFDLAKQEMGKGGEWFNFVATHAKNQLENQMTEDGNTLTMHPMGVVQVIGAYNYPYALAISGITAGLVTGNGVVVSAPLKAPNWVHPFMQAANEAVAEFTAKAIAEQKPWADEFKDVAHGLVQNGSGINSVLTNGADVVHFVGSDVVGKKIQDARGRNRTIVEMGGTNVVVVMNSVINSLTNDSKQSVNTPESIAKTIYEGLGPITGQRCTAPRLLCLQEGNAESIVAHLGKFCDDAHPQIGNPFTAGTKIGPLVDAGAYQSMRQAITFAEHCGAVIHGRMDVETERSPQSGNGKAFWVGPVAIDWRDVDMSGENGEHINSLWQHEIFGPLVHILPPVTNLDGAIAVTKRLDHHGLSGAIFTANQHDVDRYTLKAPIVSLTVNGAPKDRSPHGPHGHVGRRAIGGRNALNPYVTESVTAGRVASPAPAA